MFQNKKLMRNATSAIAEVALVIALCPPLTQTYHRRRWLSWSGGKAPSRWAIFVSF